LSRFIGAVKDSSPRSSRDERKSESLSGAV
jgi:hypothetical protein